MPTKHLCDVCGAELWAQWWRYQHFEMLCRTCYDSVKSKAEPEGEKRLQTRASFEMPEILRKH